MNTFDGQLNQFVRTGRITPELHAVFESNHELFLEKLSEQLLPYASKFVTEEQTTSLNKARALAYNNYLASGDSKGIITIWHLIHGRLKKLSQTLPLEEPRFIKSLAWSKTGNYLASAEKDGIIRTWQLIHGQLKLLQTLQDPRMSIVTSIAWNNDTYLASDHSISNILIYEWNEQQQLEELQTLYHPNEATSVAWSHNGQYLASTHKNNTLYHNNNNNIITIWQWNSHRQLQKLQTLEGHTGSVYSVAWSHNGQYLASGGLDKTIKIWQWNHEQFEELQTLSEHNNNTYSLAWSHDDKYLVSGGSSNNTIKIWQRYNELFNKDNQWGSKQQFKKVDTIPTQDLNHSITLAPGGIIAYISGDSICIISPMPFLNQHSSTLEGLSKALRQKLFPQDPFSDLTAAYAEMNIDQ